MKHFSQFHLAILILFASLFYSLSSNAQSNYQPGVVVNLQGDTLHGFINYIDWENNPKSIWFKPSQEAAPQKFTPASIKYFNVSVGHLAEYEGYTGPVSTDNTDIYKISIGRDTTYRQDTVFLKVLQHGKNVLLFSHSDSQKLRFFLSGNFSDKPVELIYRIYYKSAEENSTNMTNYENDFKGQLFDAATKAGAMSPALKRDIQKATYKEDDLINIASKINGVSATDASKNNLTKHKPIGTVLIVAGILAVVIGAIAEFSSLQH